MTWKRANNIITWIIRFTVWKLIFSNIFKNWEYFQTGGRLKHISWGAETLGNILWMPGIKYKVKLEMSISDGALEENRYGLWMAVSRRFGSNRLLLLLRNLILLTKLFFLFFLRGVQSDVPVVKSTLQWSQIEFLFYVKLVRNVFLYDCNKIMYVNTSSVN